MIDAPTAALTPTQHQAEPTRQQLLDRAAQARIALRETIPPGSPFLRDDPHSPRRNQAMNEIQQAQAAGIDDGELNLRTVELRTEMALADLTELARLRIDTGGFPMTTTPREIILKRAQLEARVLKAQGWNRADGPIVIDIEALTQQAESACQADKEAKQGALIAQAKEAAAKAVQLRLSKFRARERFNVNLLTPEERALIINAKRLAHESSLPEVELVEIERSQIREMHPLLVEATAALATQVRNFLATLDISSPVPSFTIRRDQLNEAQVAEILQLNALVLEAGAFQTIQEIPEDLRGWLKTIGIYSTYKPS